MTYRTDYLHQKFLFFVQQLAVSEDIGKTVVHLWLLNK